MERIVIVAYRPKPGKDRQLAELVEIHWEELNKEGLVSNRPPLCLKSENGEWIEIFGWKSKESIQSAHNNRRVRELWVKFAEVCDYLPASQVAEFDHLFSEFSLAKFQ